MKSRKEQNILTIVIILAIIALAILIGSIIYEEKIEENKEAVESIAKPVIEEIDDTETIESENIIQEKETEEYVGEEEQETQKEETTTQSKDEKAVDLAKKEWGEDDTVTFNVEEKNGTKYYVAVKKDATVISWYEVDTETWEISEY